MKICYVLDYYEPHIGGVERIFKIISESMVKLGHEAKVVTIKLPGTPAYEEINGVKIYRVALPRVYRRFWFSIFSIPTIINVAKDADIIHTSTYGAAISAWVASRVLRKPCIVMIHEVFGKMFKELFEISGFYAWLLRIFEKIIIKLPYEAYTCPSLSTRSRMISFGVPEKRSHAIYSALNYDYFDPKKARPDLVRKKLGLEGKFVFAFFGRPGPSKGLEYFIPAFEKIAHAVNNAAFLLVVAHDPEFGYLAVKEMIEKSPVKERIILHDPVPFSPHAKEPCLRDYMAAADCIVVPSLSEGFCLVAAEACALDRPVVATNTTAIPEVLSGRYILVPPRNADAIADACIRVARGKTSITPKKFFTIEENIKSHLKLYESLVKK